MQISIPLYDVFFEMLRRNATPASAVGGVLEASVKNVLHAGARNIVTVRCPLAIAEDLQALAGQFCPNVAPIIASVIAARAPRFSSPEPMSGPRRSPSRVNSNTENE